MRLFFTAKRTEPTLPAAPMSPTTESITRIGFIFVKIRRIRGGDKWGWMISMINDAVG
jgi:hypothetical protein